MAVRLPLALAADDFFCCLGLGLLVAVLYDAARFFAHGSRLACFVADVAAFVLAAVLLCSFSAARSAAGAPRWYMLAGQALGVAAYFSCVAPFTARVRQLFWWLAALPFRAVYILLLHPLGRLARLGAGRAGEGAKKFFCKKRQKRLKKRAKVLYNSN